MPIKNTKSKAAILFLQGHLQRKDSLAGVFAYGRRGGTEWQKGLWIKENKLLQTKEEPCMD